MRTQAEIHGPEGFEGMRKAGTLAASVLDYIAPFVKEGISTESLDRLCHQFILDHDAIPAPLGYHGYPKSICTSVNHVVCHGIPNDRLLKRGDILNIDVTVILDGWYGDTSRMFTIEPTAALAKKLIKVTQECLDKAIAVVKAGCTIGDIGSVIQQHAQSQGFSVVRDFCGHGIGRTFHAAPEVLHYGRPGEGIALVEGQCLTIEPMINAGRYETRVLGDGWSAITRDRSLSAQFEHTLGVTLEGCEVFTLARS